MGDRPIYTKPIYAPPITADPFPFYYTPVPSNGWYGPTSPGILDEVAPTSLVEVGLGEHQLATAKPGDAVPYVFGHTLVTPLLYTVMDNGGGFLLADYIISTGQCESIVSVILDGETLSVGSSPDVFNSWEFYLGTAGQVSSPLIEAAMGSPQNYDPLPNICHVVAKLSSANSPDVKFIVKGLLLDDPRTSPRLGSTASSNPALILSRVFTDAGYTVNDAALTIAANFCDESTGSPQLPRWSIDLPVYNRNTLRKWVSAISAYGSLIVDVRGGEVFIVPDGKVTTSPQTDHTIIIDDIQNPRTIWPGIGRVPKKVIVDYRETDGTKGVAEAGAGTAGNISRLRMPGYGTYSMAKRKAEEVLAKSNSIRHEHTAYDKALKTTPGDVGAITYAPHDLASKYMRLIDYRQTEIGVFRRTYSEYSDGHYDDGTYTPVTPGTNPGTNPGVDPPGAIPTGPCPVITQETYAGGERLKIEFVETSWPYVIDYLVVVSPSVKGWNGSGTVYFGFVPHTGDGTQTIYTDPIVVSDTTASPQVAGFEYKAWVQIHAATGYGASCTAVYTPSLVKANLLAWYAMEEAADNPRLDSHTNGNTLSEAGVVATVATNTGKVGALCADFFSSGTQSWLESASTDFELGTNDFTIAAWIRYRGGVSDNTFSKRTAGAWGTQPGFAIEIGQYASVQRIDTETGIEDTSGNSYNVPARISTTIATGTWWHMICEVDRTAGLMTFYVNNSALTPLDISAVTGSITSSAPLVVGEDGAAACLSEVDEVGIWNRKITAAERATIWAGGTGITYSGL